jgi:hypothetical protein
MASMAPSARDPLAATERLLIDGNNLMKAMARASASPPAALIGRLRAIIPAPIAIDLVFDGPAEPRLRNERIASGITVRYSGPRTADALILALVDGVRRAGGAEDTAALLVVTNDRELRHGAQLRGARTAGSTWLIGRLGAGRAQAASIGNPRPPRPIANTDGRFGEGRRAGLQGADPDGPDGRDGGRDDGEDGPRWKPGRGATTKRGNPRKAPRTGGAGRMRP